MATYFSHFIGFLFSWSFHFKDIQVHMHQLRNQVTPEQPGLPTSSDGLDRGRPRLAIGKGRRGRDEAGPPGALREGERGRTAAPEAVPTF